MFMVRDRQPRRNRQEPLLIAWVLSCCFTFDVSGVGLDRDCLDEHALVGHRELSGATDSARSREIAKSDSVTCRSEAPLYARSYLFSESATPFAVCLYYQV